MGVFDQNWAAVSQLRSQYQPRVTTLGDVMYGEQNQRFQPRPLTALDLLKAEAAKKFSDPSRRQTAMGIAAGASAPAGGWRGLVGDIVSNPLAKVVLKPLEILDVPRRAIISTLQEVADAAEGKGFSTSDWLEQVKDPTFGFGDYVGDITSSKWANRAIGFVGDVLFDPLTYATFGASAAAKKMGIETATAGGRIAFAQRVLEVTQDAEKAKLAAQRGLAVRKVLTQSEKELLGMPKAGVYMFGKHLPAVRIPLTERFGEAAEQGLARLRIAATSTKAGGILQRGVTQKFLKEERLALLRGEVPTEQFARKLVTVTGRDAYRAASQEATRVAGSAFRAAYEESGMTADSDIRRRLYLLLEGAEEPISDAEHRAVNAWKKAFDDVYDRMDERLKLLVPEGDEYGFGRVNRYLPHVLTPEGREFLKAGGRDARELIEVLGMDDMGPTTFFNPRRLTKDKVFFGHTLEETDLNVKRLNEIANNGGFKGNFFETDILKIADRYTIDYAEQVGRIGMMGHLKERDLLKHIDQKAVADEEAIKTAHRHVRQTVNAVQSADLRLVDASRSAAAALSKHYDALEKVAQDMGRTGAAASAAARKAMTDAADALDMAERNLTAVVAERAAAIQKMEELFDPDVVLPIKESIDGQMADLAAKADQQMALLREYRAAAENIDQYEAALKGPFLKRAKAEMKKAEKAVERAAATVASVTENANLIGSHYDELLNAADSELVGQDVTFLRRMISGEKQMDFEKKISAYSATKGEFSDYLKSIVNDDPILARLIGGTKAKASLSKMTVEEAERRLKGGFSAGKSVHDAMLGASVYVARVLYHFGGRDNVPEYLRRSLNEAEEAIRELRAISEWERIVASAPARTSSFVGLRSRYGAVVDEIERDALAIEEAYRRADKLWDQIEAFESSDRMIALEGQIAFHSAYDDAANRQQMLHYEHLRDVEMEKIRRLQDEAARIEQFIDELSSKKYQTTSLSDAAIGAEGQGFVISAKTGGTTLQDMLRDEYEALGLLDNATIYSEEKIELAAGGWESVSKKTVGERRAELAEQLEARAERRAAGTEGVSKPLTPDEVRARLAQAEYGAPEAKTAREMTRADKALVAEAGRASRVSSESRRVPFSQEQNQLRATIRKGDDAERRVAWLKETLALRSKKRRRADAAAPSEIQLPTGAGSRVSSDGGQTWVEEAAPTRSLGTSETLGSRSEFKARWAEKSDAQIRAEIKRLQKQVQAGRTARKRLDKTIDPTSAWTTKGMTSREMRYDALAKLEQFAIVQEVSRRFDAVTKRMAETGLVPPDRMLDDIMQGVRRRRQPVLIARRATFEDLAKTLTDKQQSIRSDMTQEELRALIYSAFDDVYKKLGDAAESFIGPRAITSQDPMLIRAKIAELDRNVKEAATDAARQAALKERNVYYEDVAKPFYREREGVTGTINREDVKRALAREIADSDSATPAKARATLQKFAARFTSEAQLSDRLSRMYGQIDDPDFLARSAMNAGEWSQRTPSVEIAALDASLASLRNTLAEVEAAAAATASDVAQMGKRQSELMALDSRVRSERVAVNKIEADPLFPLAKQQEDFYQWLEHMAHVRGWELTADDWRSLGITPRVEDDPVGTAALQQIIDQQNAAGMRVAIRTKDGYVQVTDAKKVPVSEPLLVQVSGGGWVPATRGEIESIIGYSPSQYKPHPPQAQKIADIEKSIAGTDSEIASLQRSIDEAQNVISMSVRWRERIGGELPEFGSPFISEEGVRPTGLYTTLPSGERVTLADLQRSMQENAVRIQSLRNERDRLVQQLNKERSFDNLRRQQFEQSVAGQPTFDEVMAQADPSKVRMKKTPRPAPRVRGKDGRWRKDLSVRLPSDEFDISFERFNETFAYQPLAGYADPRTNFRDFQFTRDEWYSLFEPRITSATAEKRAAAENRRLLKERAALDAQAQKIGDDLTALRDKHDYLKKTADGRIGVTERLSSLQASIEAKQAALLTVKQQIENVDVSARVASREVQQSAWTKFNELYFAFRYSYPNGLDDKRYKQALDAVTDGAKTEIDQSLVSSRVARTKSAFTATPEGQLIRKHKDASNQALATVVAMRRKDYESVIVGLRQNIDSVSRRLADALKRDAAAAEATAAIPQREAAKAAAEARLGTLRGSGMPTPKQDKVEEFVRAQVEAEGRKTDAAAKQAEIERRIEQVKAQRGEMKKRISEEEKRVQQLQRETIDVELRRLVAEETEAMAALAKSRKAAEKQVGKAAVSEAKARAAVQKARLRYDQSLAVMPDAVAAQNRAMQAQDALDRIARLVGLDDGTLGPKRDVPLVVGVGKAKKVARSQRTSLQAKVREGVQADARLKSGARMTDKERAALERKVEAGIKAQDELSPITVTDEEARRLTGLYRQILDAQALPEDSPVRATLEAALAAEADFLTSVRSRDEALRQLNWTTIFGERLVDDVQEGWTRLEAWGLPTMQAPTDVVEVLNNVNRLRDKGLVKELNDFVHKYTRFFKAYATLSVGFHVRNALSNTMMVFFAGADLPNMRKGLSLYNGWVEARKAGGDAERLFIESLGDAAPLFQRAMRMTDAAGGGFTGEMFRGVNVNSMGEGRLTSNALTRGSRRVGERVEGSGRFMLAYDSAVKGYDFNSGTARVKKYLFDYTDTTAVDDAMRDLVPFWIWMSRNLPMQILNQWSNPRGYAMYASLMRNIRESDDNDLVPSWLKEQGAAKVGANWYLAPDTGFSRLQTDIAEFGDPMRLLSKLNPAIRVPVEVLGNRKLYNAVPFKEQPTEVAGGPFQPLLEALLSIAGQTKTNAQGETVVNPKWNYALASLIPPLAVGERLMPVTQEYEQRQLGSLLSWFGVPLRQVTPQMRESELKRRQRAIEQFARQLEQLGYTA